MLKRTITLLAIALLTFGMTGCDSKSDDGASADESKAQAESAEKADKEKADKKKKAEADKKEAKKADAVAVPKEGREFKPAVEVAQLPKGAWHCDMKGKVHYAAMQKPEEGKCPVCNMKLVQAGGSGHKHN